MRRQLTSSQTIARMANNGRLLKPHQIGGKPRYSEDEVESCLRAENDPCAGVTLETSYGSAYFEIVKAKYVVSDLGQRYAVFELKDGSLHLRPWLSYVVDDLPDNERPVFLSCEDNDVPEMRLCDLPSLASSARKPQ